MPSAKPAIALAAKPRPRPRWSVTGYHPRANRRSRPDRWRAAVAELLALQTEYAAWLDALPDSLQASATADALRTVVDLDLDELAAINPPRGYGRD